VSQIWLHDHRIGTSFDRVMVFERDLNMVAIECLKSGFMIIALEQALIVIANMAFGDTL
jgi:hypothetical protein